MNVETERLEGVAASPELPENRASQRVMEKCGMVRFREGTYKDLPHLFHRIAGP